MSLATRAYRFILYLCAGVFFVSPLNVHAQAIPGSADVDRLPTTERAKIPKLSDMATEDTHAPADIPGAPKGAESVMLTLRKISVQGATAYPESVLTKPYEQEIGKTVSLSRVWQIAADITKKYRDDGYFLSRAFVPAQAVENGEITIRVVEGYISDVEIANQDLAKSDLVQNIMNKIKAKRPIDILTLERQHLLLADLPGLKNYQGTLMPNEKMNDGAVKLIFSERGSKSDNGFVSFDNYGSRYLGPYQMTAGLKGQLLSMQETSVSGVISVPLKELAAINASHRIPLRPDVSLELSAGLTKTDPGYNLTVQDIEGKSVNAGIGLRYQLIRQRRENLGLSMHLDARNSNSTILDTPLSKDRIRALRAKASYDLVDRYQGYNLSNFTVTRGIAGLGASDEGDLNLSRAGAKPNFTKLELDLKRLQVINEDWSALAALSGQKSSGSLYSSEEFGFGGQVFGRAYDQSEITGDDGVAASIEIRYHGLPAWRNFTAMPYGFYDIGKVWNDNTGQESALSAASAGLGLRLDNDQGAYATVQLAMPLTKIADTPLYGGNGSNPRLGVQLGYAF